MGAFDYDADGAGYAETRQADPRIAAQLHAALASAQSVLNVGAGAGSYEPTDRRVVAVEPSRVMRAQRPAHLCAALPATADALPFRDGCFDASMAILTIHHWPDLEKGLRELRRVTRDRVVLLTFDPDAPTGFWLRDYVPELEAVDRRRDPAIERITAALGGTCTLEPIDVPRDCSDRFQPALYARPEEFLEARIRRAQSSWSFLPPGVEERFVRALADDLASGGWDARYGHLRAQPTIRSQLRIVVARR